MYIYIYVYICVYIYIYIYIYVHDTEAIAFVPTVLFQSRVHRFQLSNPSDIRLPFEWRIAPGGEGAVGMKSYSITPKAGSVAPQGTQEFTVRFSPKEVESFAGRLELRVPDLPEGQEPLSIPLEAAAKQQNIVLLSFSSFGCSCCIFSFPFRFFGSIIQIKHSI